MNNDDEVRALFGAMREDKPPTPTFDETLAWRRRDRPNLAPPFVLLAGALLGTIAIGRWMTSSTPTSTDEMNTSHAQPKSELPLYIRTGGLLVSTSVTPVWQLDLRTSSTSADASGSPLLPLWSAEASAFRQGDDHD